jgi:hypothetical protein
MHALSAHRLPTGELVFAPSPISGWSWRLLELLGFLTAFVGTLSALAVVGG